jgi:hypothetical protein
MVTIVERMAIVEQKISDLKESFDRIEIKLDTVIDKKLDKEEFNTFKSEISESKKDIKLKVWDISMRLIPPIVVGVLVAVLVKGL